MTRVYRPPPPGRMPDEPGRQGERRPADACGGNGPPLELRAAAGRPQEQQRLSHGRRQGPRPAAGRPDASLGQSREQGGLHARESHAAQRKDPRPGELRGRTRSRGRGLFRGLGILRRRDQAPPKEVRRAGRPDILVLAPQRPLLRVLAGLHSPGVASPPPAQPGASQEKGRPPSQDAAGEGGAEPEGAAEDGEGSLCLSRP